MPLDYFWWGYVKAQDYTDKSASIDALEDTGRNVGRVCQNLTKRPFEAQSRSTFA